MKKLVGLVLICVMAFCGMSQVAFAANDEINVPRDEDRNYSLYNRIVDEAAEWVAEAPDTELDKLLALHEYVCLNYSYYQGSTAKNMNYMALTKTGVCAHYARLYHYLCDAMDINEQMVTASRSYDHEGHDWNIVQLGDHWYFNDTTWDGEKNYIGYMSFRYFLNSSSTVGHDEFTGGNFEEMKQLCKDTTYDNYWWRSSEAKALALNSVPIAHDGYWYYIDNNYEIVRRSSAAEDAPVEVIRDSKQDDIYCGTYMAIKDDAIYFMGNKTDGNGQKCSDIYKMDIEKNAPATLIYSAPSKFLYFGLKNGSFYYSETGSENVPIIVPEVSVPATEITISPSNLQDGKYYDHIDFTATVGPENTTDDTTIQWGGQYPTAIDKDGHWHAHARGSSTIYAYIPKSNIYSTITVNIPDGNTGIINSLMRARTKAGNQRLYWEPVENADRYVITRTRYYPYNKTNYDLESEYEWLGETSENYFDIDGPANYYYKYNVTPANDQGMGQMTTCGDLSDCDTFLGVPDNLTAEQLDSNSVKLTWDEVDGAKQYAIRILDHETKKMKYAPSEATTTETVLNGLEPGKDYTLFVCAKNFYWFDYTPVDITMDPSITCEGHLEKTEAEAATCRYKGNEEYYTCSICGKYYSDEHAVNEIEKDSWVTEALGHDPGEKTIESRVEPTCERSGSYREIIRCKRCDTILENTKINIDPNGHTLVEVQGTPPTCVGSGTADHWKCTVCGDTFSDKRAEDNPSEYRFNPYLKPLGHEIEYHEAKAPTCTEDGNKEHWLCTRCNIAFINESLSAGYNASDMVIKATGHQWDENFTIDKEPSCTEEGSKSKHCSACEATKDVTAIEKTPHAYGPWATTEEPSCTEPGSREKICADCEDKVLEEIPAKGHQWDEDFTIDKQPSCTEEGSKSKHCSACEATKDVTAIEAPGHDYEDIIVPPTCTEGGYTLHTCSRCSDSFKDSEVEAAGHAWGDWETIDAARCEAEGLKQRECAVCHVKEQNIEDALGHDFAEEFTVDQKATVGADGSMSRHCSRCDAVAESTVIPAIEDNIYFADGEFTYNGSEQKPEVSVKDVNGDAIDEANYAVSYENNINAGTAKAIVAFDSEAYEGTLQREFMINKADPVIVADKEIKVRVKKTKQIVLTDEDLGDVTFTSAKKKIATVTSAGVVKGKKIGTTTITVTATGSGNYNPGEVTIDVIVPKIIKKAALSKTTFTYNGQVQMPKIKTVNKSKKLKEGEAFEVVWPEEPVKAGKYKVTIKGIGKYDGSVTKTYKIVKAPQKISVTVPSVKVGETAQLQPEAIGSGAYTYASAARKIATVDANGVITGKKAGTVKITITKAADENYKKAVKTIKVKVVK